MIPLFLRSNKLLPYLPQRNYVSVQHARVVSRSLAMHISTVPLLLTLVSSVASAAQLTEIETRWLTAGAPVLAYAKEQLKLPIDIIVQPQAGPNDVPMAMGFDSTSLQRPLSKPMAIPAEQR